MDRALFENVWCTEYKVRKSFPNVAEDVKDQQHVEGVQQPPEEPVLLQMLHYIFKKKIPADFPPDAVCSTGDFPSQLIPSESTCIECTGNTLLSEP